MHALQINLPEDFAVRARTVREQQDAGADPSLAAIANALGVSVEFMHAAHAISLAVVSGVPVIVAPMPRPRPTN